MSAPPSKPAVINSGVVAELVQDLTPRMEMHLDTLVTVLREYEDSKPTTQRRDFLYWFAIAITILVALLSATFKSDIYLGFAWAAFIGCTLAGIVGLIIWWKADRKPRPAPRQFAENFLDNRRELLVRLNSPERR